MYPSGFQQKCIFREKVNEQIGEINRLFMRLQLFGIQDRKLIKGFNKLIHTAGLPKRRIRPAQLFL